MSVDDLAGRAAAELRETSASTFDVEAGLAALGPASRRRTSMQRSVAVLAAAAVVLAGWFAVRPDLGASPLPAVTPTPGPSVTGPPPPFVVETAVVRPDPVQRRSFVILTIRNAWDRPIPSMAGHSQGFAAASGNVLDDQVAYGWFTPTAGRKAMLVAPADIDAMAQSVNDRPEIPVASGDRLTVFLRIRPDCAGGVRLKDGEADIVATDPVGSSMVFQPLVKLPGETPWWLNAAVIGACGDAAPGSDVVDTFGPPVVTDGTGTRTVELGTRPAAAARVEIRFACLSRGIFTFEDGSNFDCTETTDGQAALRDEPTIVFTLPPGQDTTRITASSGAKWRLSTTYTQIRRVPWGVNARGQTFGVVNSDGTPDLVQVVADNGQFGYADAAAMVRSATPPAPTDLGPATVTVYAEDGQTVLGTFLNY